MGCCAKEEHQRVVNSLGRMWTAFSLHAISWKQEISFSSEDVIVHVGLCSPPIK